MSSRQIRRKNNKRGQHLLTSFTVPSEFIDYFLLIYHTYLLSIFYSVSFMEFPSFLIPLIQPILLRSVHRRHPYQSYRLHRTA